jgi:transcriptional regulator with XRE-family HTH domain
MTAKGFTQSSLAKRAGIDRSEVNRIVNDKKVPHPEELALLAQALSSPWTS